MLPNIPQFAVTMVAIPQAMSASTSILAPRELSHQLRDSGASAIVILENPSPCTAGSGRQTAKHVRWLRCMTPGQSMRPLGPRLPFGTCEDGPDVLLRLGSTQRDTHSRKP
jgi:hypothetical protein